MSGDLEDFLRRAAQRRQAKGDPKRPQGQAIQGAGRPASGPSRTPPQYSDRKSERVVRMGQDDDVLMAEVVEDEEDSISLRMRRIESTKRAAAEARAEVARKQSQRPQKGSLAQQGSLAQATTESPASGSGSVDSGNPTLDLLRLLQQPVGLRQAILLKEILDRPKHRW